MPKPVAGLDYKPKLLNSDKPNIKYSHQNGFKAELELANRVANLPNEKVIKYGDKIGGHGSDVISVNTQTGQVTLWDSKYRSAQTTVKTSPTFTGSNTLENAKREAIGAIENSNLPADIKNKALANLDKDQFKKITTGAGEAKNSVIDQPN